MFAPRLGIVAPTQREPNPTPHGVFDPKHFLPGLPRFFVPTPARQFERQHILYSLRRHDYDKAETARSLNIGISSLYRKLEELNIPKSMTEPPGEAQTQ